MDIMIDEVRIRNFRSLEQLDVKLGMVNVLIGQNNCGKSNFLTAVDIALNGFRNISADDIYIAKGEHLSEKKTAIIDIKFVPVNENGETLISFNDYWTGVFTEQWITNDSISGDYVGIRSVIKFDKKRNGYIIIRKPIKKWDTTIDLSIVGREQRFNRDMYDFINSFYMDASRDVSSDIKDKKSYFGKTISHVEMSEEKIKDLETQLDFINTEIISSIPSLEQTNKKISGIVSTLNRREGSKIEISPLSRKISDLHKGMDIFFKDGNSAELSVSLNGMGTRSWLSFLTLGAYINFFHQESIKQESDDYVMLTLEEPEAHLHPQAQKQLYRKLMDFRGQKIFSTHSTSILTQTDLSNIIHFIKKEGKTIASRFNSEKYNDNDKAKIRREVLRTRGELIFSRAIILVEGITEEQAFPIYFKEYFDSDMENSGINIIGVNGQNYKSYLNFIKDFNIDWYIFSDGEPKTINNLDNTLQSITNKTSKDLDNVIVLEHGDDYEQFLLEDDYLCDIKKAFDSIGGKKNGMKQQLAGLKKDDSYQKKRKKNKEFVDRVGEDCFDVYYCMTQGQAKAKYAMPIAEEIVKNKDVKKRIPSKIADLFHIIRSDMKEEK